MLLVELSAARKQKTIDECRTLSSSALIGPTLLLCLALYAGSIPSEFGQLEALKTLNLSSNKLAGKCGTGPALSDGCNCCRAWLVFVGVSLLCMPSCRGVRHAMHMASFCSPCFEFAPARREKSRPQACVVDLRTRPCICIHMVWEARWYSN